MMAAGKLTTPVGVCLKSAVRSVEEEDDVKIIYLSTREKREIFRERERERERDKIKVLRTQSESLVFILFSVM